MLFQRYTVADFKGFDRPVCAAESPDDDGEGGDSPTRKLRNSSSDLSCPGKAENRFGFLEFSGGLGSPGRGGLGKGAGVV